MAAGSSVSVHSASAADALNTGDAVYDAYMNLAGTSQVAVRASYLATETIATASINPVSKLAIVSSLPAGNHLFSVSRAGYLTRDFQFTVSGGAQATGDKSLIAGDVFADGIIDGSDSETLFHSIGLSYGDSAYIVGYDLNLDGILDGTETETIFANLGLDVSYYGETVDYYH